MTQKSNCCGAPMDEHHVSMGPVYYFCSECGQGCKPAKPREENYAGVEIDKIIIDEYHEFKQDHPGRWPDGIEAKKARLWLEGVIDRSPYMNEPRLLRDIVLQLEARAEKAEKALEIAKNGRSRMQWHKDFWKNTAKAAQAERDEWKEAFFRIQGQDVKSLMKERDELKRKWTDLETGKICKYCLEPHPNGGNCQCWNDE